MSLTTGMQPARTMMGTILPILTFPEASGQSFKAGEVLIASSGYAAVGSADPSAETIIGIALNDASGTQGTDVKVCPAIPGVIFEGQFIGTLAATDMMKQYGVAVTSNKWYVDSTETTSVIVTIISFKNAIATDVDPVVEFVFNPLGTIWGANIT